MMYRRLLDSSEASGAVNRFVTFGFEGDYGKNAARGAIYLSGIIKNFTRPLDFAQYSAVWASLRCVF